MRVHMNLHGTGGLHYERAPSPVGVDIIITVGALEVIVSTEYTRRGAHESNGSSSPAGGTSPPPG